MPVEIFLTKANAEPEYETIPSEEVTEEDMVIEEIVEEPKRMIKKRAKKQKSRLKRPKF